MKQCKVYWGSAIFLCANTKTQDMKITHVGPSKYNLSSKEHKRRVFMNVHAAPFHIIKLNRYWVFKLHNNKENIIKVVHYILKISSSVALGCVRFNVWSHDAQEHWCQITLT